VVLYADLDVDVMPSHTLAAPHWTSKDTQWAPPAVVRSVWSQGVAELLSTKRNGSAVRAVLTGDHVSPINLGQFITLPDARLYADGLRLLARGFHGASSGWNASGPPSSVLRRMRVSPGWMHAYTTTVASTNEDPRAVEVRAVSKAVSKAMRGFDAAWTFAYADSDQGLFVYMLLLHQPAAAFARANIGKALGRGHFVEHWAGGGSRRKPWNLALAAAEVVPSKVPLDVSTLCPLVRYLFRTRLSNSSNGWCATRLARAHAVLSQQLAQAAPLPAFPWCARVVEEACSRPPKASWPFPIW